jgi:hypothetical protein
MNREPKDSTGHLHLSCCTIFCTFIRAKFMLSEFNLTSLNVIVTKLKQRSKPAGRFIYNIVYMNNITSETLRNKYVELKNISVHVPLHKRRVIMIFFNSALPRAL